MRALLIASAAIFATSLNAQDYSSHGSEPQPNRDHCAMGHLPPEQCPPKEEHAAHYEIDYGAIDHSGHEGSDRAEQTDHSAIDHGTMEHSRHGVAIDKSTAGAAPESAVPAKV